MQKTLKTGKMFPDEATTETRLCYDKADSKSIGTKVGEHLKSNGISKGSNGTVKENVTVEKDKFFNVRSNNEREGKGNKSYYFGQQLIWPNIIAITLFHVIVVYAYLTFPYRQHWKTAVCGKFIDWDDDKIWEKNIEFNQSWVLTKEYLMCHARWSPNFSQNNNKQYLLIAWICAVIASFGVGAGVHRLWTHRSYKAKTPLRIILLCCYYSAGMV